MTNDFKNKQSSGARPPRLSPEEYAAKKKAEKEAIYQLLDNTASEVVQSPEKFKAYLDVQSRMDRYTANNALLMYKQFPQASQIKEFDDWAAEGVKVNKGSKTFIILDPYEYTKKDGTSHYSCHSTIDEAVSKMNSFTDVDWIGGGLRCCFDLCPDRALDLWRPGKRSCASSSNRC